MLVVNNQLRRNVSLLTQMEQMMKIKQDGIKTALSHDFDFPEEKKQSNNKTYDEFSKRSDVKLRKRKL